jgi:hypothetical protein
MRNKRKPRTAPPPASPRIRAGKWAVRERSDSAERPAAHMVARQQRLPPVRRPDSGSDSSDHHFSGRSSADEERIERSREASTSGRVGCTPRPVAPKRRHKHKRNQRQDVEEGKSNTICRVEASYYRCAEQRTQQVWRWWQGARLGLSFRKYISHRGAGAGSGSSQGGSRHGSSLISIVSAG